MRVALYARVSTEKQAEKYGIPSQVEAMVKRCTEKEWTLIHDNGREAFIDDGYTGADLDRPSLNRLRQVVKEGKADMILAYDPDRLSRKLYHLMILAEEFEKQGVRLEFMTQEMGSSPEDHMFFNMRGTIAEYEREKIKERTMRGRREKARQGKVANIAVAPFGFRYDKVKQTFEVDSQASETVRLIFNSYVSDHLSLVKLARRLEQLNILSPRGSRKWRVSTLSFILSNEAYIGRLYQFRVTHVPPKRRLKAGSGKNTSSALRPREEWIMVPVPAIVLLDLFDRAQRQLKTNAELSRRNTRRQYLLAGILHCGLCGGRLGGHAVQGITYYRCYHARPEKPLRDSEGKAYRCPLTEIRGEGVEHVVWQTMAGLLKKPDKLILELRKRQEPNSTTGEAVQKELKLISVRLKAIPEEQQRLVEGYSKGLYTDIMMHSQMDAISQEQHELVNRKEQLEKHLEVKALTENQEEQIRILSQKIKSGLGNLDFTGRQELLRLLIEKVSCDGQTVEIQTVLNLNNKLNPTHREG
ncbi:MAG: recombinase family protein [Dehalococcoidales bacterium]